MVEFQSILFSFLLFLTLRHVFSISEGNKEDHSYGKPIEMSDVGVGGGRPVYTPHGPYSVKN